MEQNTGIIQLIGLWEKMWLMLHNNWMNQENRLRMVQIEKLMV